MATADLNSLAMSKIKAAEISAKLTANMAALCAMLLPNGRQHGGVWEAGGINGHTGKSLQVKLTGEFTGHWRDWNGQEHKGDALDLWAACRDVSLPVAIQQAKQWLGIVEEQPEKTYTLPQDDKAPLTANGKAMHWLATERKLEASIVNRYKIQGDAEKKCIVFPSYSPSGKLVNRSFRALALDDKGKKKVWQDKDAAPSLFGWQSLTPENYQSREILICEGQIDALTWAQWGIPALSIPNGSGQTWIDYEFDNLEPFKTIYLSFDNDGKTEAALRTAISRLGKHRVRIVKFPHKDANDALKAGCTAEDAKRWLEGSEYPTVAHLFAAEHFADGVAKEFFPPEERRGHTLPVTCHQANKLLDFRFRPAELTVWTGVSSHGKSTVVNHAMFYLASATARPSLIVSLEMSPAKVIHRILLGTGIPIRDEENAKNATRSISPFLLFSDRSGSVSREELFEQLSYAHARHGIGHAVIDSMMRVKGMEENYPAQNEFVTDLCGFARDTGVHVHLVAHPRKQNGHDSPQAHDIKGSGHIRDNADNVIVVWRNREMEKMAEEGKNTDGMIPAKLIIEKDREEGEYREFPMTFNRQKRSYLPFSK